MRFLFCCEFYHPSRGGVQEVMRQIAERLVALGHQVTVATTKLPERDFSEWNGVKIEEFAVSGNYIRGMIGEVERYQTFVQQFPADAILIKAAQQWTFDALWPVLDGISARKVLIPCGFSCLYDPFYAAYYRKIPEILLKFDHLIFYSDGYRDIEFAKASGVSNYSIVPNAASEVEFSVPPDSGFRASLGIPEDDIVILTVGSPIEMKGHWEVAAAFSMLAAPERGVSLILNGRWRTSEHSPPPSEQAGAEVTAVLRAERYCKRAIFILRNYGLGPFLGRAALAIWYRARGVAVALLRKAAGLFLSPNSPLWIVIRPWRPDLVPERPLALLSIDDWIARATAHAGKRVFKTDLPRQQVVQAFLTADLFVFASNIEYSPLVLFEAAASGTPFLSVPVGNAEQIAGWTGGGIICPARNEGGLTRVDPATLSKHMSDLIANEGLRVSLGAAGRQAWKTTYNWADVARQYECILTTHQNNTEARL